MYIYIYIYIYRERDVHYETLCTNADTAGGPSAPWLLWASPKRAVRCVNQSADSGEAQKCP